MSERKCAREFPTIKQAQVNKKLNRLSQVGLIHHDAGHGGRGAPWHVSAMEPTRDMLQSLLDLSEALDISDHLKREAMRAQITPPKLIALRGGRGETRPLGKMGDPGFEPGTSSLSETRSNQLS